MTQDSQGIRNTLNGFGIISWSIAVLAIASGGFVSFCVCFMVGNLAFGWAYLPVREEE